MHALALPIKLNFLKHVQVYRGAGWPVSPSWRRIPNVLLLTFMMVLAHPVRASTCESPERLQAITRLWSDIKWFHPRVSRSEANWDKALVSALPSLMCATDARALKASLDRLLAPLHDPILGVTSSDELPFVELGAEEPALLWARPGTALLRLNRNAALSNVPFDLAEFNAKFLGTAKSLIVDYRAASNAGIDAQFVEGLIANIIQVPLVLPAERVRVHAGYAAQSGPPSEFFYSAFQTSDTGVILPASGAKRLPIVFVTNGLREIPRAILALQHRGDAMIVVEGPLSANWTRLVRHQTFDFGLTVRFAAGEVVFDDGCTGFAFDGWIPPGSGASVRGQAIREAITLSRKWPRIERQERACKPQPQATSSAREDGYATMRLPELPWRQLSVIKFWSVIDTFYPYKQDIADAWPSVLPRYFNKMRDIASARDYALTLAEMAAQIGDDHVFVRNRETRAFFGVGAPDVELRMLDGQVTVTRVGNVAFATSGRLEIGDVVLAIDGEPVQQRIAEITPYLSASNPAGKMRSILSYLLAGAKDGKVQIRASNKQGEQFDVEVVREAPPAPEEFVPYSPFKPLGSEAYYVDLTKLERKQVAHMFEAVASAKAIVFDMRGYPKETGWDIAARLEPLRNKTGPIFRRPLVSPAAVGEFTEFVQTVEPSAAPRYKGRVVILIDERTVSQGEHTALLLESVTDVTYIGSNSAGTNGDVTNVLLPGNIMAAFSGYAVKRYSGATLHPTGIVPDVEAKPTLSGIRQGRDEVLEAAVHYLNSIGL
jgi:C-terminal processing protease CtpA/Prc